MTEVKMLPAIDSVKVYGEHMHHLVGVTEIAQMLGVSRQRADQLSRTEAFPAPQAELAAGRVWSREAVETWISSRRGSRA